jgi:hypothetical protein
MNNHGSSIASVIPPLIFAICIAIFGRAGFFVAIGVLILLSQIPSNYFASDLPKTTVLDIPVKEPRRPGEVKIGFAKEYGKRSWFQALVGDHVPLIITTSILAAALVIWLIIPSPEKQPPTPTFGGSRSAVSPAESYDPCAFDFVRQHKNCISIPVPSRPTKPGKFLTVHTDIGESQHEKELVFSYENVRIVVVASENDIRDKLTNAIVWPPGAKDPGEKPSTARNNPFSLTPTPQYLPHGLITESNGSVNTVRSHSTDDVRPTAAEPNRSYIIYGSVAITCGSVIGNDTGSERILVNGGTISQANIEFGSASQRGPPSNPTPNRVNTIYVVGAVKSYSGPEKRGNSRFDSELIELSKGRRNSAEVNLEPTHQEKQEYDRQNWNWLMKTAILAETYHTSVENVRNNAFGEIDIPMKGDGPVDVSRPENPYRNPYRDPYRDRVEHPIERPPVFEHPLR